jgi:hypothetical protein
MRELGPLQQRLVHACQPFVVSAVGLCPLVFQARQPILKAFGFHHYL